MDPTILPPTPSHREQWLAILNKQDIGIPKSLHVLPVPEGLVQATVGEPPGRLTLDGVPANVLMFNISPVQGLRQSREGRSFASDMLHGDMTLMPAGVPSKWSWSSACDRLDVAVSPNAFCDGGKLDVVDRFLFRDSEMESLCRRLYREVSVGAGADRLYVESLVAELATLLLQRHSTASAAARIPPRYGLTRKQAGRVLEYIEANLSRDLELIELAGIADLSLHHFARMFKISIGAAPYKYVLERRVERAKARLRTAGTSLAEIALATGFCSQSHFTTAFRRIVSVTPAEYRRNNR